MTLWQNILVQPALLLSSIYTKRKNKRQDENLRHKLLEAEACSQGSIFPFYSSIYREVSNNDNDIQ